MEVLLSAMDAAGVSGALIIQPGNHLYDHSYVTSVLRAHPDKFVGALLANPTSVRELMRIVTDVWSGDGPGLTCRCALRGYRCSWLGSFHAQAPPVSSCVSIVHAIAHG